MKKHFLKIMFVAILGVVIGYNTYNSQKEVRLSDLALSNIEALARNELGSADCSLIYGCYWDPNYRCVVYDMWGQYVGDCPEKRG